jgi:shikimate dehydrogenase
MSVIKLGLVGHPVEHSLSPYIHQRIMEASGISGNYELFDVAPAEMDRYAPILVRDLHGFNCTIPHKERIIEYLDSLDPLAKRLKAVNTVFQKRGFNTDREGFLASGVEIAGKNVLLIGAGGVARMIAFEAAAKSASLTILARNQAKAEDIALEIRKSGSPDKHGCPIKVIASECENSGAEYDVILNATPVGMWPKCGSEPDCASFIGERVQLFDTIYNPPATRLVLRARKAGAKASGGLPMLFHQALAAQRIWNPDAKFDSGRLLPIMNALPGELLKHFPVKIVLTGFMGAGKTTVGKRIAEKLGIGFTDLDSEIERACGMSVKDIFASDGEESFRRIETKILGEFLNRGGSAIIATGGGAIMKAENRCLIQERGAMTVFLHVPAEGIWARIRRENHRPLAGDRSESEAERFMKVARLYETRLPEYEKYCDIRIAADGEPDEVARDVIAALGYGGEK